VIEKVAAAPYVIQLMDSQGAKLIEHTEGPYDSTGPDEVKLGVIASRDWNKEELTEAFFRERGAFNELYRIRNFALSDYSTGIDKFPNSIPLKKAAGRLDISLNRFAQATTLLSAVLAATPNDDEAVYYLAAAQLGLGQDDAARLTLGKLPPSSQFTPAASLLHVRLAARSQDYAGALARLTPLLIGYSGPARLGAIPLGPMRKRARFHRKNRG